jgi:hypothetical protein
VRVIALENGDAKALIVAFDLDKALYPAENLARISERTGIPVENLLFSAHTPIRLQSPGTGQRNPSMIRASSRRKFRKLPGSTSSKFVKH